MVSMLVAGAAGFGAEAVNLSPVALFFQAGIVVKVVMFGLLIASIWSWAIIFEKWTAFLRLDSKANAFEKSFWSGRPLSELRTSLAKRKDDPMARVFNAGMLTLDTELEGQVRPAEGASERITASMRVAASRVLDQLERRLGVLATVGSVAPFVGLFGTVWGIMTTFGKIGATGSTNLTVVAPGLAEALFATALGLFAAIPATMAYNAFAARIGRYGTRLEAFADEFSAHLSRELARGRI
jgi:biopolymer transport protein TolQ